MGKVSAGDKYDRLLVIELIHDKKNPKAKCICDCGNHITAQRGALKNGRTKSCGCKRIESFIKMAKTHGMSKTKTYKIWSGMLSRCNNESLPEYKNYGGRGIKVKWESFEEFYADMGERPAGHWIDRIDNNGHYEKNNCRWVIPKVNQENKRVSKKWMINDIVYNSSIAASKALDVHPSVIIRGCNGYIRRGKYHPPRDGWSSVFKY